jgi:hypothetical protein
MKRMATVITGAAVLVMTFAGSAFAQTEAPPPTTVIKGTGGTAFTGGNVTTFAIVAVMLLVVGLAALFVARRRSASQA